MAKTYTIELTDAEIRGMKHVAFSPEDWIENAVKERARIGKEELYAEEIEILNADPSVTEIPADKDAVILASKIKTVKEQNAENDDKE
jgi:hypothetical protein